MKKAGNTERKIVEVCGWSTKTIKKRKGAPQLYFETELDTHLQIKLGQEGWGGVAGLRTW